MHMKVMRIATPAAALLFALGFTGSAQAATHSAANTKAEASKQITASTMMPPGITAATAKALGYTEVTVPMKVTGFNAAVAKAHGYKVETLMSGKQIAVKPNAVASPDDDISGDCGDAFLWFEPQGNKVVNIWTGFNLDYEADLYDWNVAVTDSAGTGSKLFYGVLAADYSWSVTWVTTHSVTGHGSAEVTNGWVQLNNGSECSSINVGDSGTIY